MRELFKARGRVFYGWWMVAAGFVVASIGNGFGALGFSVFFLPLSQSLGLSRAATSLVFGAARIEGGIEGPVAGWLTDRYGTRPLIFGGAILAGVGFILLSQVNNFLSFLLVYVLVLSVGLGAGFVVPTFVAMNTWFSRRRAQVMGIILAGSGAGGLLYVPALSLGVLNLGWRTSAVLSGLFILAVATPLAFVYRRSPESMGLLPDGDPPRPVGEEAAPTLPGQRGLQKTTVDFTVKEALKTFSFWFMTLGEVLRLSIVMGVTVHLIPILVWRGLGQQEAANLIGFMAIVGIPEKVFFGWLADRWRKQWVIALVLGIVIVALLLVRQASALWQFYLFVVLLGCAQAAGGANWALAGDFFGRKSFATIRGIRGSVATPAFFLSPVYAGWIYDRTGSYSIALLTFATMIAMGAVVFIFLRPPKPPVRDPAVAASSPGPTVS